MLKMLRCISVMGVAMMVGGCGSSNFMVYKDGHNFYVTSDCSERKRILCDTGDINNIVKDSGLPISLQKELHDGMCASSKVKKSLKDVLEGMANEQRSALKEAFRRNGYEINRALDS